MKDQGQFGGSSRSHSQCRSSAKSIRAINSEVFKEEIADQGMTWLLLSYTPSLQGKQYYESIIEEVASLLQGAIKVPFFWSIATGWIWKHKTVRQGEHQGCLFIHTKGVRRVLWKNTRVIRLLRMSKLFAKIIYQAGVSFNQVCWFHRNHYQGDNQSVASGSRNSMSYILLDATKQPSFLSVFDKSGFKSSDHFLVAYKPRKGNFAAYMGDMTMEEIEIFIGSVLNGDIQFTRT
ncbi:hypothetical protein QQP08_016016 [Theobroma cacao]|nr:hypothetical protein QQP08_016016 [Theobroma cacao]